MPQNKQQTAWGLVFRNGHIDRHLRYSRRDVIRCTVATHREWRRYREPAWAGLTDAQFWRKLKREQGLAVRRIALTVLR